MAKVTNERVEELLRIEEERFRKEHPQSKALFEQTKKNYVGKFTHLILKSMV